MGIPDCSSFTTIKDQTGHVGPVGKPDLRTKILAVTIMVVVWSLSTLPARPANAYPQDAGAILSQVGDTYRHLKSYSFNGVVQATIEVDNSEYRSTYAMELVSPGDPHVGVRFSRATPIRKIAGTGPAKPGLAYPAPSGLGFQFYRLPEAVDSAKIMGQGSVAANGKAISCLIVEIHWRLTANNQEAVKGGVEKLWVDKASHLVLKASFAGFNDKNPAHPHLVEHWVIAFQSYQLNGAVPSWYHANDHPLGEGEPNSGVAAPRHMSPPPAIGSIVPEFTLKDLQGQSESLAGARGNPVLIDFWATWCVPCRGVEASLERLKKQLPPGSLTIFRITNEEPGRVRSFLAENHENFPTLVLGQKVWDRFDVYVLPTLVLINSTGNVVLYHKGSLTENELLSELKKIE
ncbi:MAG TPA: TlpA disulfide reductase family protein [Terriglobia bacterium]|nr:TlpA disulfide reductase family protein [Terriglobia bacterium]